MPAGIPVRFAFRCVPPIGPRNPDRVSSPPPSDNTSPIPTSDARSDDRDAAARTEWMLEDEETPDETARRVSLNRRFGESELAVHGLAAAHSADLHLRSGRTVDDDDLHAPWAQLGDGRAVDGHDDVAVEESG